MTLFEKVKVSGELGQLQLQTHWTCTHYWEKKISIKKENKRINTNALKKGLNLLKNKARYPELDQWRVGLISGVSPTHTKLLSASSQRKVLSIDEKESRDTLGKLTSRALRKYESIAENAARGRFPSEFPKTKIKFDYAEIGKIF